MASVSASVVVPIDVEATWSAATDWAGQHRWVLGSRVRAGALDGRGVGATIVAHTGYGRLTITDPMEVTVWDPPRTVTLVHTGQLVTGSATYRVEDLGDGRSRFTWSEELLAPTPLLRGPYALGTPAFGLLIRASLRRFARWAPTRT